VKGKNENSPIAKKRKKKKRLIWGLKIWPSLGLSKLQTNFCGLCDDTV